MSALRPFSPKYGSNQVVSPASSAANITIEASNNQVRVVNTGTNKMYFKTFSLLASPTAAATTADFIVMPGMSSTVTKDLAHDTLSHISASGTTSEVMTGDGW